MEIGEELPFKDSFGIEWYLPAMAWAKEQGIAKGGAEGTFSASRPLLFLWGLSRLGRFPPLFSSGQGFQSLRQLL